MILKALYDYYHRTKDLPKPGCQAKEIEYVIVINNDGSFVRLESRRINPKQCTSYMVAKGVKRSSGVKSNILWDKGSYVLGSSDGKFEKHNSQFVEIVTQIADSNPKDVSIQALRKFYEIGINKRIETMKNDPLYDEAIADEEKREPKIFSFQLLGDTCLIAEKAELFLQNIQDNGSDNPIGRCLITGKTGPIVRLTTSTPILGCKSSASLVSMQTNSGFDSYDKSQVYNSPISEEAEFAFSTAILSMLARGSSHSIIIGNRTFLAWGTGEKAVETENALMSILNFTPSEKDENTENSTNEVKTLFKSIWSGSIKTTLDDRFYILGLAPNAGRIAIVSWSDKTLKEFANIILEHFNDTEIVDNRPSDKSHPYQGVPVLISSVTLGGKLADATPNLVDAMVTSVISGTPYPYTIFTAALQRIRAELNNYGVSIARAAILKAYLNRKYKNNKSIKPLEVMLDTNYTNPGYLCGRLAATLEKIQEDADSGDSIRTRYMTAASATPSAVFSAMLNLSNHHMEKLSTGRRIFFEQLKQEIINKLPGDGFPQHLNLDDQGRFFVGYYHQRAEFFKPRTEEQ